MSFYCFLLPKVHNMNYLESISTTVSWNWSFEDPYCIINVLIFDTVDILHSDEYTLSVNFRVHLLENTSCNRRRWSSSDYMNFVSPSSLSWGQILRSVALHIFSYYFQSKSSFGLPFPWGATNLYIKTCPHHCHCWPMLDMSKPYQISLILIYHLLMLPTNALKCTHFWIYFFICLSFTTHPYQLFHLCCTLFFCMCCFLMGQHSAPYVIFGLVTHKNFPLIRVGLCRLKSTTVSSLHFNHHVRHLSQAGTSGLLNSAS